MCPCSCLRSWCPSCFQTGGGAGHVWAAAGASCLTGGCPPFTHGQASPLLHCAYVPSPLRYVRSDLLSRLELVVQTESLQGTVRPHNVCLLDTRYSTVTRPLLCRCDPFTYEPYEPYDPKAEQQAASASVGARHCPHDWCTSCPSAAPCFAALLHDGLPCLSHLARVCHKQEPSASEASAQQPPAS